MNWNEFGENSMRTNFLILAVSVLFPLAPVCAQSQQRAVGLVSPFRNLSVPVTLVSLPDRRYNDFDFYPHHHESGARIGRADVSE
jgi:hypothetical protein